MWVVCAILTTISLVVYFRLFASLLWPLLGLGHILLVSSTSRYGNSGQAHRTTSYHESDPSLDLRCCLSAQPIIQAIQVPASKLTPKKIAKKNPNSSSPSVS